MSTRKAVIVIALALLSEGCATSLDVRTLRQNDPMRAGISYVLPFTQYTVTQTWRVADCTPGSEKVAVKVEATLGQADDGDHAYLIDPASLQRLLTVSDFNATFQEGGNMLRTVNASIEDRTGPFIGNIVKTAVALAPLAFGVPPLPPPGAAPATICRPAVVAALDRSKELKVLLDAATADVVRANDDVVANAAIVAQMGTAIDDATRARFGTSVRRLHDLQAVQTARAAQLADALKPITYQRIVRWPETSRCYQSQPFSVDTEALSKWFLEGTQPSTVQEVHLAIERVGSYGRQPISASDCPGLVSRGASRETLTQGNDGRRRQASPPTPALSASEYRDPSPALLGLRYRSPAQGRLVACTVRPCRSANAQTVLTAVEGPVAQLGLVNVLPVRAITFGSNTFTAEFRANGSLNSAGYAQRAAPLEAASATVASATESLAPLFDPAQRLARDTTYLEAEKRRRDALEALQPAANDPTDAARQAFEADTSLLTAEIAKLQAQITLRDLQARLQ